jgi:uncharacterized protein
MPETQEILAYLAENKDKYARLYQITKIGIFGSYARGEQTPESDIDLIVEFEDNTENLREKKISLKSDIESRFHRPVNFSKTSTPFFPSCDSLD